MRDPDYVSSLKPTVDEQTKIAAAKADAAAQAIGYGGNVGSSVTNQVSNVQYPTAGLQTTPTEPAPKETAAERLARIQNERLTGNGTTPPYEAPAGTHWSYIAGEWKLYKDFGTVSSSNGNNPPSNGGNGDNPPASGGNVTTYTATDGTKFTDQMAYATYQSGLNTAKTNADILKTQTRGATTTALEDFKASLKMAGLDSLADTIDGYIKNDLTAAQVKINIIGTQAYKDRFPGMDALRAKGLAVDERTYINMERGYDQTLRAYGLDTNVLATRERLGSWIANEVSPAEFENRVSIAADRVTKNTDVLAALQNYYGISTPTAITWLLDPKVGMELINKEVRAAEIGAAAQNAGFKNFGPSVAESFVNASGKEDLTTLKTDFQKAYQLAGSQSKLAQIEGENYNDISAVKAVLAQDQAELMQSQKRAAREAARFGGSSGLSSGSLKTESSI